MWLAGDGGEVLSFSFTTVSSLRKLIMGNGTCVKELCLLKLPRKKSNLTLSKSRAHTNTAFRKSLPVSFQIFYAISTCHCDKDKDSTTLREATCGIQLQCLPIKCYTKCAPKTFVENVYKEMGYTATVTPL